MLSAEAIERLEMMRNDSEAHPPKRSYPGDVLWLLDLLVVALARIAELEGKHGS